MRPLMTVSFFFFFFFNFIKMSLTCNSTLAWKIPWMEEPGRLQSMGSLESDLTERHHFDFSLSCTGEENGNPLQCSCLENPRDGGACWAAVYGVAQSRTRLKQLNSNRSSLYVPDTLLLFKKNKGKVLVAQSCLTFAIPWTVAHQAPLSMEFSRQEYWSG